MKYLLPFIILCCTYSAKAQNYCPNGSFEQYANCPVTTHQIHYSTGWSAAGLGNADFLHSCHPGSAGVPVNDYGHQAAASGNAYAGLFTYTSGNSSEYIKRTITPLSIGEVYEVSLSVSLSGKSNLGNNGLGVLFYDNGYTGANTAQFLPYAPHVSYESYGPITDTTNWVRLTGSFIADSAYDNIIIGPFTDTGSLVTSAAFGFQFTSYYYIDSIVIRQFGVAINFTDTTLCPGDTISVPYVKGTATNFNTGNTFSLQLSDASGSFVSPATIGTVNSVTSGNITGIIPTTASGSGYRLRIVSTSPLSISPTSSRNIKITNPLPAAGANTPLCAGQTLFVGATGSVGSTYSWTGPSFTSALQNVQIPNTTVSQSGDYIVTALLNGCAAKDTVTVLVKPIPAVPTAGSNSPVCSGNSLNLAANSNTNGVSYNWTGPLSYTSTLQNPIITNTTTSMSGNYSVTATLNGCTSASAIVPAIIKIIPASPTAASNSPVCAGGALNLTASSTTPGVNYNWTGPNGFASTAQNPSISPVPLNAGGVYSVTAEANGCVSPAGTVTVTINNVASLGVYPSPNDTLCANNANASFVAVPFNAGSAPQYQWFRNNMLIGGATNITYPATGIADGDSFYCRMTAIGLCADPLILYSNKLGMTVLPLTSGPTVTITADPGTLLSPWQLVKFTAVATNAGAMPKYQWKRNGQDVIGAMSNVWSANNLANGDTISCIVTSDVWCATPANTASNRMVVNIKTGIKDIDGVGGVVLYPNPNNGSFTVNIPLPPFKGGNLRVDVVDALGRSVYKATNQPNQSTFEITLPASVGNGAYMLKLQADGVVYHARFTVSR